MFPQATVQMSLQPPFLQEKRWSHVVADTRLCTAAWHYATLLEISHADYNKSST